VQNRINRVLKKLGFKNSIKYVGRRALATTAVGSSELHKE
jgi:2-oxoglutarate dehydrogenase complex dehydrogenase (E1) component-like enzyme